MGCIRVDRITDYLAAPLAVALKDQDPYVKKTAALCVAKLYDINAELVEEQGLIDELRSLISDSNAMVVANAVLFFLFFLYDLYFGPLGRCARWNCRDFR